MENPASVGICLLTWFWTHGCTFRVLWVTKFLIKLGSLCTLPESHFSPWLFLFYIPISLSWLEAILGWKGVDSTGPTKHATQRHCASGGAVFVPWGPCGPLWATACCAVPLLKNDITLHLTNQGKSKTQNSNFSVYWMCTLLQNQKSVNPGRERLESVHPGNLANSFFK